MAAILGISAFYHDSAAALLIDGEIIAAAQEERFSRRKHDDRVAREFIAGFQPD
jgi:carbamoyltransferase